MSFLESSFLWFDAVLASVFLAAALSVVGVYSILRRVVFLPATLSSVSGCSVVLMVLFSSLVFDEYAHNHHAGIFSLIITLIAALALGMVRLKNQSRELIIGVMYIVATSLTILLLDKLPPGHHHMDDILFGNAVIVERFQMWISLLVSVLILVVHICLVRVFMFVSFDPQTAAANCVPVVFINGLLFITLALTISIATRTIGALPVFAYSILPAQTAMFLFKNPRLILIFAAIIGGVSAFVGYYASFIFELPTGASTAFVSFIIMLIAFGFKKIIFKRIFV